MPRRGVVARPAARGLVLLLGSIALALLAACGGDEDVGRSPTAVATPQSQAAATATPQPAATAATPARPAEVRKIAFMAGFRPQANLPFVAAYVADALGYYAEEGLEVDIQHSAGQGEHLRLLLEDQVQFTTATGAQVLRRRADALPVVAVALFGQRGDQGYVVRADSGIEGPADFAGRTVGFKGGVVPAELKAMLATVGLSESDINLVGVPFDVRPFLEGQVDVYPVFLNNEPFQIRQEGVEITEIDPHDFGVPTLGLTFLALEQTVADDPALVEAFLRASLRGAQYAAEHLDEAVEITLRYAQGADAEHQRFLLETDIAAAQRADGMGRADQTQWEALDALLREHSVILESEDTAGAFDGSIVDSLYDEQGRLR